MAKKCVTWRGIRKLQMKNRVPKNPNAKATVKTVKTIVKRAVRNAPELKMSLIRSATDVMGYGSTFSENISNITQGDGIAFRAGRKIFIKGLHFRGVITPDAATANANFSCNYRIIIARGKKENGTNLLPTDIIANSDGLSSTYAPYAHYNFNSRDKYSILYDSGHRHVASGWTNPATDVAPIGFPSISFNKYIKVNKTTTWWGDTNSIQDGGIYFMVFSDLAAGTPSITVRLRCYYTDA